MRYLAALLLAACSGTVEPPDADPAFTTCDHWHERTYYQPDVGEGCVFYIPRDAATATTAATVNVCEVEGYAEGLLIDYFTPVRVWCRVGYECKPVDLWAANCVSGELISPRPFATL